MKADARGASIFGPAFLLMSGRTIGFIAAFMLPVVLVRVFTPAEFGTYKQLFLIYSTLYGIAQLGMAESLYYFVPTNPHVAGRYASNAVLMLSGAGTLCLLIVWSASGLVAGWFNNPELARYLPAIGIFLLLMLISAILEILMISRKQHALAFKTYVLSDVGRTVLCLIPALIFHSLAWLLAGLIAFGSIRVLFTLTFVRRQFHRTLGIQPEIIAKHLRYAVPFAIAVTIDLLQSNWHFYVVSTRIDAATFAIYAIGCLQIPLVDFMMSSTGNVMMVRMSEEIRDGRPQIAVTVWRDTTRKLALLFVPLVGALLVTARNLIPGLFTPSYSASVPLFMVWSLMMLLAVFLTDAVLRVFADTGFIIKLNLLKLMVVAMLISIFLTTFGLIGAVMVTLVAGFLAKSVALIRIRRLMRCSWGRFLPWRSLAIVVAIGTVSGLPALLFDLSTGLPRLIAALMAGLIYCAIYALLIWRYGPLSVEERGDLLRWLQIPLLRIGRGWRA